MVIVGTLMGAGGQRAVEIVVLGLARGEVEAASGSVDHDVDVTGLAKAVAVAVKRRVVEFEAARRPAKSACSSGAFLAGAVDAALGREAVLRP